MAKTKMPTAALQQSVGDDPKAPPTDYETQDHLQTLIKSHEIMNDPVKMKAVHKLAGRHKAAVSGIRSIQQLRDLGNQKSMARSQGKNLAALQQGGGDAPEPQEADTE